MKKDQTMKRVLPFRWFDLGPGVVVGLCMALAMTTMANDSELDTGPRVFVYKGILDIDGVAVDRPLDLLITVTDDADCNVVETHQDVTFNRGRFAVEVGSVLGGVDPCVFHTEKVYLRFSVREGDEEGAFTALSGLQRIYPAPFAYWAAEGSNLDAQGNTFVGGTLHVQGELSFSALHASVGSVSVGGALDVDGDALTLADGVSLVESNAAGDRLLLYPNGDTSVLDFGSSITTKGLLSFDSNVAATDDVNVTSGDVEIDSLVRVTGTGDSDEAAGTKGLLRIGPLDGKHLTLDNDEIQAYDGSSSSSITVNSAGQSGASMGGDVVIGNNFNLSGSTAIDIARTSGSETVSASSSPEIAIPNTDARTFCVVTAASGGGNTQDVNLVGQCSMSRQVDYSYVLVAYNSTSSDMICHWSCISW